MKQSYFISYILFFIYSITINSSFAQTTYTFSALGSSSNGFKTITTSPSGANIIVSDNMTFYNPIITVGVSSTASFTCTIKGDGVNTGTFTFDDMLWGPFTGSRTLTNTQIVFKDSSGNTIDTWTLSAAYQALLSFDSEVSAKTIFGETNSVANVAEVIITADLDGSSNSDNIEFKNITLSSITAPVINTAPVIGGTSAGQSVNDNSTIAPFSSITTMDADDDNLSATITLDNDAKGILTGTGLSGSGPYTIASTTPTDLQSKLRALSFNPTDNRTATSETTTFTVVINDGTTDDTDNTTTVISNAVAPTVSSVSVPANATYVTGQNLDFTVNFNENVTVNTTGGIPQIAITIGATTRQATYISGSGTSSLVFRHTILTGDLDTDGIAVGSLAANGSTLKDAGGKDANLTLNSIGSTAAVLVDAVSPTVTSVSVPINGNYLTGQNLDFTVNFDENITVNTTGGTPQIAITIGATTRQAAYQSGSGTSALVFRYTVQSGDSDTDGIAVGALATNGGTLKDDASNDAALTLNGIANTTNILVGIQTITWTGSMNNDWSTASNWDLNVVPPTNANVVVPSSGVTNYPTISSPVTVNSITINSGASLIATSSVTASVTYKRSLPTTNWYLISPPVAGETLEDIIANHTLASGAGSNLGIGSYDNNGASPWSYATPILTGSTIPGYGFSIKLAAPGDVSITGNLVTTNYGVPIGTGTRTNYNLLGNPYTNYINSATLAGSNPVINNATFWLWDGTKYITHNNANPIEIAPSQGFFVEANSNSNVIFFTSNQSHQGSDTFMKQEPIPSIELSVENGNTKRSTQVFYISGKTTGYDRTYDSKMFGGDTSGLAVFTELLTDNQGKQLAIQTLPNNDYENMIIPVGLRALSGKEITFSADIKNLPDNLNVYLEDKVNNTFTNLSEKEYTITLNNNSNSTGQFYLHTSAKSSSPTLPNETKGIELFKPKNSQVIIVKGLQSKNATLKIFSLSGKQVFDTVINSDGYSEISIPKLASGVYLVELVSDLGKIPAKIILD